MLRTDSNCRADIYCNDIIHCYTKDGGQNDQVIYGWHSHTLLPLVYRIWSGKSKYILQILYRKTCILSKLHNISACSCHVNCWYITHNTSLPKFSSHLHCYNCDRFLLHKDELKNTQKTPIHMNTSIILTWMDAFSYIMIPIYKC